MLLLHSAQRFQLCENTVVHVNRATERLYLSVRCTADNPSQKQNTEELDPKRKDAPNVMVQRKSARQGIKI